MNKENRILNNTFSLEHTANAIKDIQTTSFNYLYQLQKELVSYRRFDMTGKDLCKSNEDKYEVLRGHKFLQISGEFIPTGVRKLYKRSKYYQKILSSDTISEDNKIFPYNFLVFIGGFITDNVSLLASDETTYIILNEEVSDNIPVTIWFVPNNVTTDTITNMYIWNRTSKEFKVSSGSDDVYNYLTAIKYPDKSIDLLESATVDGGISSETKLTESLTGKSILIRNIGLKYHLTDITVSKGEKYFEIPVEAMPITTDSMMVFSRREGNLIFEPDVTVQINYPNIYKLSNSRDELSYLIKCFYYNDNNIDHDKETFTNRLSLLERMNYSILDGYRNNNLPDVIKEFEPSNVEYSIRDFENKGDGDTVEYKIDKFKDLISRDSRSAIPYLDWQLPDSDALYIDVSNINLSTRVRRTTSKETPDNIINFSEDMYVIVVRKTIPLNIDNNRLFIDGRIRMIFTVTENPNNTYIYIPCRFIQNKSIIEFESNSDMHYYKNILFDTKSIIVDISDTNLRIHRHDIMITDMDGSFINPEKYYIDIVMDGSFMETVREFNTPLTDKIRINLLDESLIGIPLKILYIHKSFFTIQNIPTNRDRGRAIFLNNTIDRDKEHFRIFRNGSLIPPSLYDIKYRDNIKSVYAVDILVDKQVDDEIIVDVSPHKFREVYYQDTVDISGFIDLSGHLNKPFSFRYYDVYLNGLRLNLFNVDIISPTKILLFDLDSIMNFLILERERDDEYFSIKDNSRSFDDELWDRMPGLSEKILLDNGLLNNTESDVVPDVLDKVSVDIDRFNELYIRNNTFLNPDVSDLSEDMWKYCNEMHVEGRVLVNPDIGVRGATRIELFPEVNGVIQPAPKD